MSSIKDEWSNLHLNENNPSIELNPTTDHNTVLREHHQVMVAYHNLDLDETWLLCYEVKNTPKELFYKHITPKPISPENAIDLAIRRERFATKTHCFEDPVQFHYYPVAGGLWISMSPVRCYTVVPTKDTGQLLARSKGYKWAIFEYTDTNPHHFNLERWYNVPTPNLSPKT